MSDSENSPLTIENAVINGVSVDFTNSLPTAESIKTACEQLKQVKWCEKVIFSYNDLTIEGLTHICNLITENRNISSISLAHNNLDVDSFSLLAKSLPDSDISTLILEDTNLTDTCLTNMKDLKHCRKLCHVNLSHNNLSDDGISRLVFYFAGCNYLSDLNLSYNSITIRSLKSFASLLEECDSIKTIDLSGMPMDEVFACQFRQLGEIAMCTILVTVDTSNKRDLEQCKSMMPSLNTLFFLLYKQFIYQHPESDLKLALNKEYLQEEKEKEAYSLSDMLRMIGDVKDYFTPRRGKRWDAENAAIRLIIENMQLINEFLVVDAKYQVVNDRVENQIQTTQGLINRCGQLRIEIVALLGLLLNTKHVQCIEQIADCGIVDHVFDLYTLFPWNSTLHFHCNKFFYAAFTSNNKKLRNYMIQTFQIQSRIQAIMPSSEGYASWMPQLSNHVNAAFKASKGYGEYAKEPAWLAFMENVIKPMKQQGKRYSSQYQLIVCTNNEQLHNTTTTAFLFRCIAGSFIL